MGQSVLGVEQRQRVATVERERREALAAMATVVGAYRDFKRGVIDEREFEDMVEAAAGYLNRLRVAV